MKKLVLITLVLTLSIVLTLAAVQVLSVRNPTPNVGWNTWVPQYQASTLSIETVSWAPIMYQPNVGWNT
jgi:hypothetical protein